MALASQMLAHDGALTLGLAFQASCSQSDSGMAAR